MSNPLDSLFVTASLPPGMESYLDGFLADRVTLESPAPRVKVRRVVTQLLTTEPTLDIEEVVIRGRSGCSDFVGTVNVRTTTGVHVFDFVWDCRWRAEHEGYVDYFGFPDQARAAREFDWQCFRRWERRSAN